MKVEKYNLESDETFSLFEFVSTGPKGIIPKIIDFQSTDTPGFYNLAFGDKNQVTGEIDDLAVTNNGDTNKVLGTVAAALYIFTNYYPYVWVYATGSTTARTRLYRMGITRFHAEIQKDFLLFGRVGNEFFDFETGKEYEGFLAQRKWA